MFSVAYYPRYTDGASGERGTRTVMQHREPRPGLRARFSCKNREKMNKTISIFKMELRWEGSG